MPEDTFDKLEITFTAHTGAPGTDSDPHNPLARALSRLLKTGKPFGWIHACYFNPLPMAKGLRWLGIFMYSEGDRVIYFPGLREPQAQTFTSRGSEPIQRRQFQVDHLSLEADRRDWHLTGTGAKPHIGTYRSTDLGQGRVLWFGMSIASPDVLRLVHTRTLVDAQVPPTDARRRGDVIMRAREDVVFNEVLFNGEHRKLGQPSFAHFTIIAGPCGFPRYQGEHLAMPFGSPYIKPALGTLTDVALRLHRVSLEPHVDLEIIAAILPGTVTVPVTFTSP